MANIGPAYSFFFSFGLIVITAGIGAPLTIVAAAIAIALLGNTLAQFSRAQPSTGGFITFVGKSFGGTSAVTTALLCGAGYIIAISSVLAVPVYYLSKPGQPAPYSWFPYAALAILIVSTIYAAVLTRRDPGLAGRVGSIVADE